MLYLLIALGAVQSYALEQISADKVLESEYSTSVTCHHSSHIGLENLNPKCISPTTPCRRRIVDGLFSEDDITRLHGIAEKGMATRESVGGPTILDINTGFIRDSMGLDNLFSRPAGEELFSAEDFAHYGSIIRTLRQAVSDTFDIDDSENVYFTAPTFITRLDATKDWKPKEIYDEYWHAHVDRNNTPHYQYSGLLYMSSYGSDFTGGRLTFYNTDKYDQLEAEGKVGGQYDEARELIMEPRRGRVVIFSSGHENIHRVEPVETGQRFVLSFWFTCNSQKQFEIFLDGQSHIAFSQKIKKAIDAKKSNKGSKK